MQIGFIGVVIHSFSKLCSKAYYVHGLKELAKTRYSCSKVEL